MQVRSYFVDNDNKRMRLRVKRCNGSDAIERRRSWNNMQHDILVNIMMRLTWRDWALIVCYVCKSWLSALLDALFPIGNHVLDLGRLTSIESECARKRFRHYIMLVLNGYRCPATTPIWTDLLLSNIPQRDEFYHFLGQRLPLLRVLIVPKELKIYMCCLTRLVPHWKKLRVVHTRTSMVHNMSIHCKYICHLSLYGLIGNNPASQIATQFPLLKRLVLQSCMFSMNALSVILDGHKNLELLDTRHGYRISDEELETKAAKHSLDFRPTEWNEEEIREKTSGVKIHLLCAREHCPECSHLYKF